MSSIKLTVFFDDPFWVGVFERIFEDQYQVQRHVFGSEPKDYQVYDFVLNRFSQLNFSDLIPSEQHVERKINPKKMQKKIGRELEKTTVGTKAQNALKLQYETDKIERKQFSKELKEEIERQKFEFRQAKKKEKHKGH